MTGESKAMIQVRAFFDRIGWRYVSDDTNSLMGLVGGEKGRWHWGLRECGEGRFLVLHGFCPVDVPANRRPAAAEYLTRANCGLHFGNFDMDWSGGQVVLRTCIPVSRSGVSRKVMEHMVFGNCSLMDRYLPGLLAVALGGEDPKKAQEDAERHAEANSAGNPPDPPAVAASDDPIHAGKFGRLFSNDN